MTGRATGFSANDSPASCGSAANCRIKRKWRSKAWQGSCCETCIADFGRSFAFAVTLAEFELSLLDPMHESDAGDRHRGAAKARQSKHWTQTKFDGSMLLFARIVQIFRRSYFGPLAAPMLAEDFPGRAM
jgi:hypothetical protein